ncbi:general secretion pathway protein GspK [Sinorhizobium fredii]|uniref:general secretion pathway protein GspK n=1 Tax=Rhizobium fredii TaxID=380 RepID=UPI001F0B678D|nr:general secretion pathway protein GspK [Sinorhizobium fredii]
MLLISAAIAPLAIAGRVQTLSAAYTHERREFEVLAEGLARTIFILNVNEKPLVRWQRCETERYVFYLDVQDQRGLVDLNSASLQLLQFGFRAVGLNEAGAIAATTVAERYRSPSGGGVADGSAVDLKHAPFEDVSELADISGAETISTGRIPRIFTVFNQTDTVASRHVDSQLRQVIEAGRGSEFLAENGDSSVSEVSIARVRKGRPSGFMFRAMMERAGEEGDGARMLRRSLSVVDEGDLGVPLSGNAPCGGVAEPLIRSYDP